MKKLLLVVAGTVMTMAPAMAAPRAIAVRPNYGGFYRGGFYGRGFYGSGFYDPFWGPYGYAPYVNQYANTGQVKIETKVKEAEVFVNGGFAGTVKDAHNLHLRPGQYTIEVRYHGQPGFSEKVYVTAGKTVKLNPGL